MIFNYHGRIWADSEGSGHGSTFSFSVPTATAKPEILKLEENLPKSDQLKPLARPAEKAEEL